MPEQAMRGNQFAAETRLLFQAGLAIFLITVIIGILNGLDVIEFDRNTLLTHVHAGALGWLSLGFLGACLWLFSEGETAAGWRSSAPRWLSWAAICAVALYVLAFYLGNLTARPVAGTVALVAIAGFFAWIVAQARRVPLSTPRLAALAAIAHLTLGALVGVLLGISMAGGLSGLPPGIYMAHPSTMVVGYLILAGMAIAEGQLMPERSRQPVGRLGMAQVALPFLGGITLTIGALLDVFVLIALNVPFEILGVLIFLWRVGPRLARVPWRAGNSGRYFGLAVLGIVANVGLLAYLIANYAEDFDKIPPWLIFALDHAIFIGVMTNALFGLVYEASHERRTVWPWADHVVFWAMNVGVVGFVFGLALEVTILKQVFAPIMGIGILLAQAVYTVRLQTRPAATPAELAA